MNSENNISTVLVTAYAKAPQGSSMYELYKYSGIVLEIDPSTDRVVDAEFTFITQLAQNFFRRLIIGYDLSNGIEDLVKRIENHYFAPSANSVIVALKSAYRRYMEHKQKAEK
ncbi:DUF3870 domain-containing protein [Parageobacillus sp. VR-IP]|uniref:DUF3870 domain-containing protein n=1 Tax=Parageobacillus sp. VR-IP TaxID=2742205 RepID=UPI00158370CC|nr:DUF3870 domain-containing protein [Parageobacillus sp. VR-IP]NUK31368.1 DUF3870 domain-containing protein [Parageobacillus sp. VR-IP]